MFLPILHFLFYGVKNPYLYSIRWRLTGVSLTRNRSAINKFFSDEHERHHVNGTDLQG